MSLTAIIWLGLFGTFALLTFRRSSWGIPLYMLTLYMHPPQWWWGRGMLTSMGIRWNLLAALIFAVGVLLDERRKRRPEDSEVIPARVLKLLLLYAVSATVVHFLLVSDAAIQKVGGLGLLSLAGSVLDAGRFGPDNPPRAFESRGFQPAVEEMEVQGSRLRT